MLNKIELLKKIKTLTERGVGGEKETAQAILQKLMRKYNILETELEEEQQETVWFSFKQDIERRLLGQVIYMVTGMFPFGCIGKYTNRRRKKLGVKCTAAQKIEIEISYEFYKTFLYEEMEIFIEAFICRNGLFPPGGCKDAKDTIRDEEHNLRVVLMMNGMKKRILKKMIVAEEERNEAESVDRKPV